MDEKEALRKRWLPWRKDLPESVRREKSRKITETLKSLALFKGAKTVAAFRPLKDEPDIAALFKIAGKTWLFPEKRSDGFYCITGTPDLFLVPGVAFDRKGNRLGRGGGHYDRLLASFRGVPRLGVAFAEQVLDRVPKAAYDEAVDSIVTDTGLF